MFRGWSNSTTGTACAMYAADLGSILHPIWDRASPRVISEYWSRSNSWVWFQNKNQKRLSVFLGDPFSIVYSLHSPVSGHNSSLFLWVFGISTFFLGILHGDLFLTPFRNDPWLTILRKPYIALRIEPSQPHARQVFYLSYYLLGSVLVLLTHSHALVTNHLIENVFICTV